MNADHIAPLTEGYFRWRCRRGMKELDFILNRFLDAQFSQMNDQLKVLFNDMLAEEDMLLWYWLSGKTKPTGEHEQYMNIVEQICAAGYHR
ncbi:MAG: succinate dehydrogenase assembly factor 2 [Marinicella sp.]